MARHYSTEEVCELLENDDDFAREIITDGSDEEFGELNEVN